MPLEKRTVNVNFGQGLDTKTDPFQVKLGKFLSLVNTVFSIGGMIKKRNGFPNLISAPASDTRALGTSRNNLITVGKQINVYDPIAKNLNQTATYQTCDINVVPLIRDNDPYSSVDSAVSANGYICIVTANLNGAYYKVLDASTGTVIVNRTLLDGLGKKPKVVLLGNYFFMVYTAGTSLLYKALPTSNPALATTNGTITATMSSFVIYDIALNTFNGSCVAVWGATSGFGYQIINANLTLGLSGTITGTSTGLIVWSFVTIVVDAGDGSWWLVYLTSPSGGVENLAYTKRTAAGAALLAPTVLYAFDVAQGELPRTGCGYAAQGAITIFFDSVVRLYDTVGPYIGITWSNAVSSSGVAGALTLIANNVFIGTRAFLFDEQVVVGCFTAMMTVGSEAPSTNFYSTNFIVTPTGRVLAKYSESLCGQWYSGGPWNTTLTGVGRTWPVLCSISQVGSFYYSAYLIMEQPLVTKALGVPGYYVNTGVDAIRFTVANYLIKMAEIAGSTFISGGQTWQYDGNISCELGYHTSPQNLLITGSATGGGITPGTYYYQAIYEWSDASGNPHRSAPSPLPNPGVTTTGSASSVTISIPTLTMTNKTNVTVKIYRSSLTSPLPREVTNVNGISLSNTIDVPFVYYIDPVDEIALVTYSKNILYTSLGQLPNDSVPASYDMTVFKSRLFIVTCEDRNSIFFSKPVIAGTAPEFSDLFTIFVNPSISSKVNTGPITAIFPMDDKLIIFKQRAIYYIAGEGPDNDGTDNTFTDPIYISATIGCISKQSVVITPMGLIFQSDKGLWALGRDLSTQFIGAAIEQFLLPSQPAGAQPLVISAQTVPNTNEVRFGLSTGEMVMFDYFYQQWGEFAGLNHIYSTIYQDRHTLLLPDGENISRELPGTYLDSVASPVFVQFTTAWINLAGVQGLERAYFFNILGQDVTPHNLQILIYYDYGTTPLQEITIAPNENLGGTKQGRFFLVKQKCQSFQLAIQEFFPTDSTSTGPGFTISGLDVTVALKKGYPTLPPNQSGS